MRRIYLDHAATTPLCPEAWAAMVPWLEEEFGNPSSLHQEGRRARQAIDEAREHVSARLGCLFAEVVFTSSGTEAMNLALIGFALANRGGDRQRILMSAGEHHAALHAAPFLRSIGFVIEFVPMSRSGRLALDRLESSLDDDVLLLSLMHANNELGTIQPVEEAAALCRPRGIAFLCDAVQTFCRAETPWTVDSLGADLVAISAHKVNGPKGVGALYVGAGTKLQPLSLGGGQERELRAGTENVAGIAGFGAAVRRPLLASAERSRDEFLRSLEEAGVDFLRSVPPEVPCLSGHAHLRMPGITAESMLIRLDRMGVAASSGAACSSGSLEPSHVLLAAGYSESEAKEGLRFTMGSDTVEDDAREAAFRVAEAARAIRG